MIKITKATLSFSLVWSSEECNNEVKHKQEDNAAASIKVRL